MFAPCTLISLTFLGLVHHILSQHGLLGKQQPGGGMGGEVTNTLSRVIVGGKGGGGGVGGNKGLPPGYANIRGEVLDMSNKVIQRSTAAGTNYFTYENQNGAPIFRRREVDNGRRFVLFPDLAFPNGDGHYIVLRKMPGVNIPGQIIQPLYETFRLSLGDSIHAYVTEYNQNQPVPNVNQHGFDGLAGSYGAATSGFKVAPMNSPNAKGRTKRKSVAGTSLFGSIEMTLVDLIKEGYVDVVDR